MFVFFYQFYIIITEDNTLFICRLISKTNPKHSVFFGLKLTNHSFDKLYTLDESE
jgi:hypothetical protein